MFNGPNRTNQHADHNPHSHLPQTFLHNPSTSRVKNMTVHGKGRLLVRTIQTKQLTPCASALTFPTGSDIHDLKNSSPIPGGRERLSEGGVSAPSTTSISFVVSDNVSGQLDLLRSPTSAESPPASRKLSSIGPRCRFARYKPISAIVEGSS
jgi:hypothetical protein